jgi:hypothetical protein
MKVNIYSEIFNILNEYELLLNIYHDKKFMIDEKNKQKQNNYDNKEQKNNVNKNLNEFMDNDFLNYIFNSIKIKKNESLNNNLNQPQNNEYNDNIKNNDTKSNDNSNNDDKNLNNDKKSNDTESNYTELNDNKLNNNNEITNFIKKYYRKIVILTHPDKTNDIIKNNIFKKAKDNIENKFLIGIIKNCYDLKFSITD